MRRGLIVGAAALAVGAAGGAALWLAAARGIEARVQAQIAALERAGVSVAMETRRIGGFPSGWRVETQGLRAQDAAGLWRVEAPVATVEIGAGIWPEDGARVRLSLPRDARLSVDGLDFALEAEALGFDPFSTASDASEPGEDAAPRLTADRLTLRRVEGAQPARATFEGFALERASAGPGGRAALLRAAALDLDLAGYGAARFEQVEMSAEADGMAAASLAAFQAAHGVGEIALRAARGAFTLRAPLALTAEAGPSRLSLSVDAGGATLAGEAEDVAPSLPVAGGARIGRVTVSMALPLRPGPEPGRYALRLALVDAVADAAFWAAFDPDGALSHEAGRFEARISGEADLRAPGAADPRPLRVRTIEIETFAAQALGARAEATGLLRLRPGAATPDGEIALRVERWRETLQALRAAGAIGPDQFDLARLMAETYGRNDPEPGALVSRIRLQDGAVFANGARVR